MGPLDRETKSVYEVIVSAKDGGAKVRSSKATVRIIVTDVNDNIPVFVEPEETTLSVREDQPSGTQVLQVGYMNTFFYSVSYNPGFECGL